MTTRRQFIGANAALVATSMANAAIPAIPSGDRLSILFLGGTGFIGPHQIEYALARGHEVAMFNRGSNPGLYGDRVEEIIGNRDANIDAGLSALEGSRRWDVVVDNSGYVPRHVLDSAELLANRCSRYVYISTTSVYDFERTPTVDHESPLHAEFPDTEEVTGASYGPLKAECDLIVQDVFGDRATIIRPTVIVGPGDRTDRFTYWVDRFHRGGDILCPPDPEREAAWIDARDLCHWLITLAEEDQPGIFNAAGPASPMNHEQVMSAFRAFSAGEVRLNWPTRELVDELDVSIPWFWAGANSRHIDASASIAAGLRYRSLAESITDTYAWWRAQSADRRANARGWPTPDEERQAIARLRV